MKITKVIRSKRLRHTASGATVSIFGAVPWMSESEADEWEVITGRWTWQRDDGCFGLCRPPAKTEAEAIEVMEAFNARGE